MSEQYKAVFTSLSEYIVKLGYKGYDPYDTLNGFIPFEKFGRLAAAVAIQIQKKNPVNIRPLFGIKQGLNPKGMGLILKAYSMMTPVDESYRKMADEVFQKITTLKSKGYSGACWGYNFNWVSPSSSLPAFAPSVVVTSFVIDGLLEYYKLTGSEDAAGLINSASEYILSDIPVAEYDKGLSFAYTHLSKGSCYNASLLAAEILAKADHIAGTNKHFQMVEKAVNFVLSKQREDGSWYYSYNPVNSTEYKQIDFHQGFVLVSLENIKNLYQGKFEQLAVPIKKGLQFYRNEQFSIDGRAKWRLPAEYPTDIHNQTQGIITFCRLSGYSHDYRHFAKVIMDYTVENFRDLSGYFYYRRGKFLVNKIPYIRWSQAWMLFALAEYIKMGEQNG